MKPCRRYRKLLALHAASVLSGREEAAVRDHLRQCASCNEHFTALASLAAAHYEAGQSFASVEPTPGFFRRITQGIRSDGACERAFVNSGNIQWKLRIGGAVAGFALLGFLLVLILRPSVPQFGKHGTDSNALQTQPSPIEANHITYRLALNRSFEALDELLTQAGMKQSVVAEPIYRVHAAFADPEF